MRKLLARLFGIVGQPQPVEERVQDTDLMLECPECRALSGAKTHFGCMVNDVDWIATCASCGHKWGPGMDKYSNLLP
jgi:hypothetical protein